MTPAAQWRRYEAWAVVLVAIHSYAVGIVLLFATRWGMNVGGFGEQTTLFFPRQGGVFHFVLATGYLLEYFRHGGVSLVVVAKLVALIFLSSMTLLSDVSWAVPFLGLADGFMGVAILWIHLRASRAEAG